MKAICFVTLQEEAIDFEYQKAFLNRFCILIQDFQFFLQDSILVFLWKNIKVHLHELPRKTKSSKKFKEERRGEQR